MENNAAPNEFESHLKLCKLPTKWLNTYVTTLLLCWIIFGILFSIFYLTIGLIDKDNEIEIMVSFIIRLIFIVLMAYTRYELLNFSELGYALNLILSCAIPLNYPSIQSSIAVLLCFTIPNIIYFRKRKELFGFSQISDGKDFASQKLTCEYCEKPVAVDRSTVYCKVCNSVYHLACARQYKKCKCGETNLSYLPGATTGNHKTKNSTVLNKTENAVHAFLKISLTKHKIIKYFVTAIVIVASIIVLYFAVSNYTTNQSIKSAVSIIEQMKDVKSCKIELKNDTAFIYVKTYVNSRIDSGEQQYIDSIVLKEIRKIKYTIVLPI